MTITFFSTKTVLLEPVIQDWSLLVGACYYCCCCCCYCCFYHQGLEIGPNLGMVKSSSLESLHNVMHHTIKRDIVDDGSDLRNRSTRNSFRRAVDRSYDNTENERNGEEQRGVDGTSCESYLCY